MVNLVFATMELAGILRSALMGSRPQTYKTRSDVDHLALASSIVIVSTLHTVGFVCPPDLLSVEQYFSSCRHSFDRKKCCMPSVENVCGSLRSQVLK